MFYEFETVRNIKNKIRFILFFQLVLSILWSLFYLLSHYPPEDRLHKRHHHDNDDDDDDDDNTTDGGGTAPHAPAATGGRGGPADRVGADVISRRHTRAAAHCT